MSQKREFVRLAQVEGTNISQLCSRYAISRETAYELLRCCRSEADAGLVQRCRPPYHAPERTSAAMEATVVHLRGAHPAWSGRKIRGAKKAGKGGSAFLGLMGVSGLEDLSPQED